MAIAVYHVPRGGQSVGRHPNKLKCFLPPARVAYAKWWIRMLFHSLESSDLPSPWGSRLTLQNLAFGTRSPPTLVIPGSLSLALALLFHTRWGFESLAAWASRSQSVQRSSSSWKGTSQGYICNPSSPRERDAASGGHTSGIPVSACFIPRSWHRFHRTCFYGSWSLRRTARGCVTHQLVWLHTLFRAWSRWRLSQSVQWSSSSLGS